MGSSARLSQLGGRLPEGFEQVGPMIEPQKSAPGDSNADRFCAMTEEMGSTTERRFLVITHHPMTMSRMNRLFGVAMQEKGVSQLVSVDLQATERFREAS